jgi:hypothetical protein
LRLFFNVLGNDLIRNTLFVTIDETITAYNLVSRAEKAGLYVSRFNYGCGWREDRDQEAGHGGDRQGRAVALLIVEDKLPHPGNVGLFGAE